VPIRRALLVSHRFVEAVAYTLSKISRYAVLPSRGFRQYVARALPEVIHEQGGSKRIGAISQAVELTTDALCTLR